MQDTGQSLGHDGQPDKSYLARCQKTLRSFPKRKWRQTPNGWILTCHGEQILIGHSRHNPERLGVKYRGQCVWTYKGKPITNFLSAAYAAFNLVDPVPEVARARGGMLSEGESAPTQDLRR
jgi:hypothetical protein